MADRLYAGLTLDELVRLVGDGFTHPQGAELFRQLVAAARQRDRLVAAIQSTTVCRTLPYWEDWNKIVALSKEEVTPA